jgi:hypothetical protein
MARSPVWAACRVSRMSTSVSVPLWFGVMGRRCSTVYQLEWGSNFWEMLQWSALTNVSLGRACTRPLTDELNLCCKSSCVPKIATSPLPSLAMTTVMNMQMPIDQSVSLRLVCQF